jgi:hypothetical protein
MKFQIIPNKYWGPALVKHRRKVNYVKDFVLDPNGDKRRLAYVNQAYSNSSYSYAYSDDQGSLGTRVSKMHGCIAGFLMTINKNSN